MGQRRSAQAPLSLPAPPPPPQPSVAGSAAGSALGTAPPRAPAPAAGHPSPAAAALLPGRCLAGRGGGAARTARLHLGGGGAQPRGTGGQPGSPGPGEAAARGLSVGRRAPGRPRCRRFPGRPPRRAGGRRCCARCGGVINRSAANNVGKGSEPGVLERRSKRLDPCFSVLPPASAVEKGARREFGGVVAARESRSRRAGGHPGPLPSSRRGMGPRWGWRCPCRFPACQALLPRQGRALRPAPQPPGGLWNNCKISLLPAPPKKRSHKFVQQLVFWLLCG